LAAASNSGQIRLGAILWLAIVGFMTAQCKSAYLVLLALAFAIPVERYGSRMRWLVASLLIVAPGIVCGIAWMISLRHTYFAGIHYFVRGVAVYPDGQVASLLADPIGYAGVVARTIFLSPLIPISFIGLIGLFGPPVLMPTIAYPLVAGSIGAVFAADGTPRPPALRFRLLAVGAILAGSALILTLLYIQWNGVGAPVIQGFSGRYLYPLSPLLLMFLPTRKFAIIGLTAPAWATILGLVATCFTLGVTWATYWA